MSKGRLILLLLLPPALITGAWLARSREVTRGYAGDSALLGYDPQTDPLVNPTSLFEPFDEARAVPEATLLRRLQRTLNPIFNNLWEDR